MTNKKRTCIDCGSTTRPAPFAGPRCASDNRIRKKKVRDDAFARRLLTTYNITVAQYDELYAAQGGTCAICKRATGRTKRLSVDHDHAHCDGPISCGSCCRGLLCQPCNRMLGHLRDDPEAFIRAANYLTSPPAYAVWHKNVRI